MRKVGRILLASTILSAFLSPIAIGVVNAEPELKLAQAPAPQTEEQKKKQQQQRPPAPPQAPQRQAPPPPQAPHPPQAAPIQPPRPPQAPAQTQPPPHAPPQAPAQAQPPHGPPQVPAQTQPPPHAPPQAPAQAQPPHGPPQVPAQIQPPPRVPRQAPAQIQPPPRVPPTAPAQVQPPPHTPPTNAPAQVQPSQPPANAPARNEPPRRQPPPNTPAQAQPPQQAPAQVQPTQPPANAPARNEPPRRQPAPNAPLQTQPPPTAPTQAAPTVRPQPGPAANVAPPPALPAPTAAQARPLQRTQGPAAIALTTPQGQPVRRVDQLRSERNEVREGNRTIIREPDRVIVREGNGVSFIRHSDVDRFRYGARDVRVETRGRDNVTSVVLPNGQRVVTVLDVDGRLLRRSRFLPDGREIVIINQRPVAPGSNVFVQLPPPILRIPRERYIVDLAVAPPALVYDTLMAPPVEAIDQAYSLDQVRYSYSLRERMPSIDIDTINFETGSWEVAPDQVDALAEIADGIKRAIEANPQEVFLIEGHTDAVGNDVDNLSLSDRRAETVALVMSDKFSVPPENMVTQGYGEQYLRIQTDGPERRNRRVTVRRITPLLDGGQQALGPPPGPPPQ